MKKTVKTWLRVGGRMIDAAQNYLNEVRHFQTLDNNAKRAPSPPLSPLGRDR
jgi:diketogulonate reductase-like aldo/keto reductase